MFSPLPRWGGVVLIIAALSCTLAAPPENETEGAVWEAIRQTEGLKGMSDQDLLHWAISKCTKHLHTAGQLSGWATTSAANASVPPGVQHTATLKPSRRKPRTHDTLNALQSSLSASTKSRRYEHKATAARCRNEHKATAARWRLLSACCLGTLFSSA